MKIVVFGATGFAGGNIAAELASRGHQVIGVARSAASGTDGNLTMLAGSIFDSQLVASTIAGADAVVVAMRASGTDGKVTLGDITTDLLAMCEAAGARLAYVGGAGSMLVAEGAGRLVDQPEFPDAYKHEALAHADILATLRAADTSVDWFYVSPAGFFGKQNPGERTGKYRTSLDVLLSDAEGKSYISGADLAVAFADEIENPKHRKQRFQVAY
ncbi:MAG: hypothetical protein RL508_1114 [Actinomycetota bacterium]